MQKIKVTLMIIIMFWGFFFFLCLFSGFFIRPFYKMMLGKQISLKDMESVVRFLFALQNQ